MASKRIASTLESTTSTCKKRVQTYRPEYTLKHPFIKPATDETRVLCEVCNSEFGIKSGGADDIRRHVEGPKHVKNNEIKSQAKTNSLISCFFNKAPTNNVTSLEMDVIKAETKMVDLVIELNLPMSSLDKLSKGVKAMFHDSKIAKSFQCARSKGTAIAKEMSAITVESLVERLKTQCFTISTDGSNDKGGEKLFPLVVRTFDPETKEVRSDALSVPAIEGSATGAKIFALIEAEFNAHGIPWENCLALGSDNANVMVGKEAGVYGCMLKKNTELYLSGCVCHLIHIAAEKGAACLPFSPTQLLIDVYYYLDKSSKRQHDLKCHQLLHDIQDKKILKHVATRWLSIGKCLPRLISSWEALYTFFRAEEKSLRETSNAQRKVKDLKRVFSSQTNKLYCMFLLHAVKDFEAVNTDLQCDQPMIHKLHIKLRKLFKETLVKFVKPSAVCGKDILEVDFMSKENIQPFTDIIIGEAALELVLQDVLKKERVEEFYNHVVKFYQSNLLYMKKKLPLSDPLLQHIRIADPTKQDTTFTDMLFFLKKFPQLMNNTTLTQIQTEFNTYQCTDTSSLLAQINRADNYWLEVSQIKEDGEPIFGNLCRIMLALLTIPHSSAHCERIFSVVRKNKTEFRGGMSRETLEALVVAKSRPGDALQRSYTNKQLKSLKSAYYRSLQA